MGRERGGKRKKGKKWRIKRKKGGKSRTFTEEKRNQHTIEWGEGGERSNLSKNILPCTIY